MFSKNYFKPSDLHIVSSFEQAIRFLITVHSNIHDKNTLEEVTYYHVGLRSLLSRGTLSNVTSKQDLFLVTNYKSVTLRLRLPASPQLSTLWDPTAVHKSAYIWNTFFHLLKWNPCPFLYTGLKLQNLRRNIWDRHKRTKKMKGEKNVFPSLFFLFNFLLTLFIRFSVFFLCVFRLLFRLWFVSLLILRILEGFLSETMTYITYWPQCIINEYLDLDKKEVTIALPSNSCRDFRTGVQKLQFSYGISHQYFLSQYDRVWFTRKAA